VGVNPWTLMAWMGHKRIDETMLYVHVARDHRRTVPPEIWAAAGTETDPDRRVLLMLGERGNLWQQPAKAGAGQHAASESWQQGGNSGRVFPELAGLSEG